MAAIDPWWPAAALAGFQVLDGIAVAIPTDFNRRALDRVNCPDGVRRVLPWVKWASALGLAVGIWVPAVGLVTGLCLVAYFLVAIAFHIRERDTLLSSSAAVAMLVISVLVTATFA